MSEILLTKFSSRTFMLLSLTFNSLIYFELILVYGVRRWSSFIFLHIAVQFSQRHLLNRLFLPHCMFLPPLLSVNQLQRCGFMSGLSIMYYWSICLLCQYHAVLIAMDLQYSLISGTVHTSNFVILSQDCCGESGTFVVPYKFLDYVFQFCEIHHWNLDRNCIESVDCFGQYGHFNDVNSSYP